MTLSCFSCHKEMTFSNSKVGLREECPYCQADVHVCRNCDFYDPRAYNDCRESSADRVTEKERSNFCDYFVLRAKGLSSDDEAAQLKAKAEALFKKG